MGRYFVALAVGLLLAFAAGWKAKAWQRDSLDLQIERAARAAGDRAGAEMQAIASASARELEEKLEAIRKAPPKEIRTELVKPVFTNRCMSDEFVRMYNAAAANAERALSGKSADNVPAGAAASGR